MPDKCLDCPAPSADMDGFIVSGPGGAPRSEGSGVSSPEGPFVREAPQTGHFILKGKVSSSSPLPDAPQVGWAYVAGDPGTYGGVQATEGDVVYCMSLNPVKWGVLQADSDDSGRDLVSVSAAFGCDPSPVLSLTSTAASGEEAVQEVDMSCLSGMYGALESLSASFWCRNGYSSLVWIPSASARVVSTVGIDVLPPDRYFRSLDLPVTSSQFVFKGSDYDYLTSTLSSGCDIVLSLPYQGETLYYVASANVVAKFFNGDVHVGAVRHFLNSYLGFRLKSREELTSQDPGGPDIVCTFLIVAGGGDFLSLTSKTAAGDSEEQIIDLSCLHADSLEHVSLSASCPPDSGLSLELRRGDGTQEIQNVDMSCFVPPVFDGSVDGLVPVNSPATQTADLLSDDGTWMRPATNAEIDAIFGIDS